MNLRKALTLVAPLLLAQATWGQEKQDFFNHMDLGITVSATGLGADIAMPVGDYVRLRTGFTYMPRFQMKTNFGVEMNGKTVDADKLRRMKDMMKSFTGVPMQDNVDIIMKPTWGNFKFLVDIMPFKNNKHWNLTLGFYAGPSRIGKAVNTEEAFPTLVAVNTYNSIYNRVCKGEDLFVYERSNGNIASASLPQELLDKVVDTGMMGMPLGTFDNGEKAMMVPDANYVAKAEMHVNKFRPYLGLGYTTNLSRDGRFRMAVDAGVMLWGGHPSVYVDNVYRLKTVEQDANYYYYDTVWMRMDDYTYEDVVPQRIDLTRDVQDIRGKVGDMVKTVKHFKCYPMLSITFSRSLF